MKDYTRAKTLMFRCEKSSKRTPTPIHKSRIVDKNPTNHNNLALSNDSSKDNKNQIESSQLTDHQNEFPRTTATQ